MLLMSTAGDKSYGKKKIALFLYLILFVCLFVCLFVYRPIREFFTHMEMSPLPVKGCKFWPMLGTNGHWTVGVLSAPHLLQLGASVYNNHLRGPVALTPIVDSLAVELPLPVFTTKVCRGWDSKIQSSARGANAQTHCVTAAVIYVCIIISKSTKR